MVRVTLATPIQCVSRRQLTSFAEPFEDEIHPRLRFAHRGIVAMANNGTKNSNDSQFFITLGTLVLYPLFVAHE